MYPFKVAKLLAADYSECFTTSIVVLRSFINLITHNGFDWRRPGVPSFDPREIGDELSDAFDEAYVNVVDKFSNKRYHFE